MRAIPLAARPSGGVAPIGNRAAAPPPGILAAQALHQELADQDLVHQTASHRLPMAISDAFVSEILKPYREHARYLKSAELTQFSEEALRNSDSKECLVTGVGRFSIPESCYIDDTGHFNAVEFNICFNQLAYVAFGKCLEANILKNLRLEGASVSFGDFKRHQLANMLIVSIESRYYKMLKSDDFTAELTINRISASAGAYFVFTSIAFADAEGIKAKGTVLLAFAPPKE
jgi:hypothetical protein